jgi:hypothetical protein
MLRSAKDLVHRVLICLSPLLLLIPIRLADQHGVARAAEYFLIAVSITGAIGEFVRFILRHHRG